MLNEWRFLVYRVAAIVKEAIPCVEVYVVESIERIVPVEAMYIYWWSHHIYPEKFRESRVEKYLC